MEAQTEDVQSFLVKDCSLVAIATGKKAQNLRELRDGVVDAHPGSIYYHFWGAMLRPTFDDPQFHNDFAIWTHYSLHDEALAERLAIIDPVNFEHIESLRQEVLEIIEQRLEEIGRLGWMPTQHEFHFVRSHIVVFDTNTKIDRPEALAEIVPKLPVGCLFYHFIDARRRNPDGLDDFRVWLAGHGEAYQDLCYLLSEVDPYFVSLKELRQHLADVFANYFGRC
jgi:hypothetical protein